MRSRHFWRFDVRAGGHWERDRGWGWTRERAEADVRRKWAKRGDELEDLVAVERVCPPGRHSHPGGAAGSPRVYVDGGLVVAAAQLP